MRWVCARSNKLARSAMKRRMVALCWLLVSWMGAAHGQTTPPHLILINGKVVTVDDRFSVAEALAVKGERLVAVGKTRDIVRLTGPDTYKIDVYDASAR